MVREYESGGGANISGAVTALGFGRGGIPSEVGLIRYVPQRVVNISGAATGAGFGRGGVPREVNYVLEEKSDARRF